MKHKPFTQVIVGFVLTFGILLFGSLGCSGGGTGGTGVRSYEGTLKTVQQTPVAGAQVTILETGDSATTDQSGAFSIADVEALGDVQLLVESGDISAVASVSGIPTSASVVTVALELDTSNRTVTPRNISSRDDREHTSGNSSGGGHGSDDSPGGDNHSGNSGSGGSGSSSSDNSGSDNHGGDHGGGGSGSSGGESDSGSGSGVQPGDDRGSSNDGSSEDSGSDDSDSHSDTESSGSGSGGSIGIE